MEGNLRQEFKASDLLSLITPDKTSKTPRFLWKLEHRWSDSRNNFCVCLEMKVIKNKKKIVREKLCLLAGKWWVIYCILTFS